MSKPPIQTQIVYDKHSEFQGLEIFLDGNRKIIVDNMEPFEPLSKYLDAEKLIEISNMKINSNPVQKLDAHLTLYDYNHQRPQTSNQDALAQIYQDVKRETRPQSKGFSTRTYSAFTKKRKQ